MELLSIERKKNKPCLVFKTGSDVLFEFCYLADERENLQRKTQTLHNPNTKKKKKKYFHLNYSKSTSFNWQKNNAFYRALCIDKCIHWDVLQLKADNHWILNGKNKAWIGLAILTTVNSAHLNRQCKMCQSLGQKWSYFHYVTDDFFQK